MIYNELRKYYFGETGNTKNRHKEHSTDVFIAKLNKRRLSEREAAMDEDFGDTCFKHAVDLEMLFDNKEDFIKKVVYDKSFGEKGVIVLKKPQFTNPDSGKPSLEEVLLMFQEMNDEVADLILGEFFGTIMIF
uniref:DUF4942 domain-containing protein n=1 Tax=Rhabditophanes sp. KR3021 TaxID=114890 RepID=A0AC35TZ17_9BILA